MNWHFRLCIVNTDIRGECENPTQIGFVPQIKETGVSEFLLSLILHALVKLCIRAHDNPRILK